MTQQVPVDASLIAKASDSSGEGRAFVFWPLILVGAIVAVVALTADAFFTADQRMAVFQQSGVYP
jgi:hypothetical protein